MNWSLGISCVLVSFQLFSSALVQRGKDKQGIMGFMVPDIKSEITRGRRLVSWTEGCSSVASSITPHAFLAENAKTVFDVADNRSSRG